MSANHLAALGEVTAAYIIGALVVLGFLAFNRLRQIQTIFRIQLTAWIKSSGDAKGYVKYIKTLDSSISVFTIMRHAASYHGSLPQPRPISFWDEETLEPPALIFIASVFWPIFITYMFLRSVFLKLNKLFNEYYIESIKRQVCSQHKLEILTSPNADVRSLVSQHKTD